MTGREGLAYRGVVRKNGKKIGEFHNDGDGGADFFYFNDPKEQKSFDVAVEKNTPRTTKLQGETVKIYERDSYFLTMLLGG